VPPTDAATCPLGLEVLDKVIRSTALHLTPRNVDSLLGFLLKVAAACGPPPAPGSAGGSGSSSAHSTPARGSGAAARGSSSGSGGGGAAAGAQPALLGSASLVLALRVLNRLLDLHLGVGIFVDFGAEQRHQVLPCLDERIGHVCCPAFE
jgi:hypothetical protein